MISQSLAAAHLVELGLAPGAQLRVIDCGHQHLNDLRLPILDGQLNSLFDPVDAVQDSVDVLIAG